MTASLERASPRAAERTAPDAAEAIVRFSITPMPNGAWLWRTFDTQGDARNQGLAACRKQAAALVIRDIVRARCEPVLFSIPAVSAQAA
jgi:hypothetical protein